MKKQSVLKKEFQRKDVERLRNIVTGKLNNKTTTSVGFSKKEEIHFEGDIWEEDGRTWTIEKGVKHNITKLDSFRKKALTPLLCPSCGKVMKNVDKSYHKIHGMCLNCVVDMEHKLKLEGKWEEYEKKIKNDEIDKKIADFRTYIEERFKENSTIVTEDGDIENWEGKLDMEAAKKSAEEFIEYLESLKK